MSDLLRKTILEANDINVINHPVEAWGVTVQIRSMSAADRAHVQMAARDEDGELDLDKLYPLLVIYSCYDPDDSQRIFTEDDIGPLKAKNGEIMEEIAGIAMKSSGMDEKGTDRAAGNS